MPEKKTFHNIIGGEVQASADGAMMDIVNRRPGEVYASAPNSSAVDVDQACQAAGAAFEKSKSVWRTRAPSGCTARSSAFSRPGCKAHSLNPAGNSRSICI